MYLVCSLDACPEKQSIAFRNSQADENQHNIKNILADCNCWNDGEQGAGKLLTVLLCPAQWHVNSCFPTAPIAAQGGQFGSLPGTYVSPGQAWMYLCKQGRQSGLEPALACIQLSAAEVYANRNTPTWDLLSLHSFADHDSDGREHKFCALGWEDLAWCMKWQNMQRRKPDVFSTQMGISKRSGISAVTCLLEAIRCLYGLVWYSRQSVVPDKYKETKLEHKLCGKQCL